ncbi:hypothetical protein GCM10023322_29920 [Rugosimonospora acidiphila]|uniref:Uncharacterized protein n=1 Tax=Rugosimonospora acidiphila TaxID=556531 RepID=A0ABP9RSL3_9ACTN
MVRPAAAMRSDKVAKSLRRVAGGAMVAIDMLVGSSASGVGIGDRAIGKAGPAGGRSIRRTRGRRA